MSMLPEWAQQLFITKSGIYDMHFLIWSDRDEHVCREIMISENDPAYGFDIIIGSCNASYGADLQAWDRVNIGKFMPSRQTWMMVKILMKIMSFDRESRWDAQSIEQRR